MKRPTNKIDGREARRRFPLRAAGVLIPRNPLALINIFSSLKNRNFAIYFAGMSVTLIGAWIQQVAMGWLVFNLTNSVFLLSVSVFLSQIPSLVFTPFAGVVCDRFNRRSILMVTQSLMMLQSAVLGILTVEGLINMPIIFALCFFVGTVVSFDAPARQSFYAKLVPPKDLSNAIALNSTAMNGSRFIGPAIGGVMISFFGEGVCFLVNAASYGAILLSLYMIKLKPETAAKHSSAIKDIMEGYSYIYSFKPIRALIMLLMVFSFFAMPFSLLLPAFTKGTLGGGSAALGNMMSCVGCGALGAALYLAARKSVLGMGRVIVLSCALAGIGLVLMSMVDSLRIAYILAVPVGFGMIAVAAGCNTMLQSLVDEEKRGRVMSVFTMSFFGFPPLGSLAQGYVSHYVGLSAVTAVSGAVCILAAIAFELYRPVIRMQAREIYAQKGLIIPEIARGLQSSIVPKD